jgi:hypothetical protein
LTAVPLTVPDTVGGIVPPPEPPPPPPQAISIDADSVTTDRARNARRRWNILVVIGFSVGVTAVVVSFWTEAV